MTKQQKQSHYEIPFGPTSPKQQMIMDCKAQILIMGGELLRHNMQ